MTDAQRYLNKSKTLTAEMLTDALDMLMFDDFAEPDELHDMLINEWHDGMNAADLYTAVRDRAGVNA